MQAETLAAAFTAFRDRADMRALARVFDATAPELLAIARHLAGRREDAEDLVQATFLTAIERAESYDESRPLVPWLLGVLALHARKQRERAGRELDETRVSQRASDPPDARASSRELVAAIERAVETMPPTYASVVRRHLVEGAGPGEIAGELGITPANARVRLHRGLKLLRAAIPSGFAGAAVGWLATWRSLRGLKREVLARASAKTGAALPSSVAITPIVVTTLAVAALSAPAWWPSAHSVSQGSSAGDPSAQIAAPSSSSTMVAQTGSSPTTTASPQAERVPVESKQANSPVVASVARRAIRGRLLLPDGSPAAGARVELAARQETSAWRAPAPVTSDAEGRFELACAPEPRLVVVLGAALERHATMKWHWNDLARENGSIDIGDATFERAGTLALALVDSHGAPLSDGWSVDLFDASESRRGKQDMISRRVSLDRLGVAVLTDLAPRRYQVHATRGIIGEVAWTQADVAEGRTSELRLAYDGPDPERRIGLAVRVRGPASSHDFDPSRAKLVGPDGQARTPTPVPRKPDRFLFEDVAGGGYELSIDDPRFLAVTRGGISAGESLEVDLVGAASIALRVRGADGREIERYDLSGTLVEPHSSATPLKLRSRDEPRPERSIYAGFLPGDARLEVAIDGAPVRSVRVERLRAGEVREVEVVFERGLAIAGRVLEGDRATPTSGATIELTRGGEAGSKEQSEFITVTVVSGTPSPQTVMSTTSADDGSFRFEGLEPGQWTVRARWNALLTADRTVVLADNVVTPPLELAQPPCGWFEGQAAPRTNGARMLVVARRAGFDPYERRVEADVGEDGRFRLGPLPVDRYRLDVEQKREPGAGWGRGQRSLTTFGSFEDIERAPKYAIEAGRVTQLDLRGEGTASVHVRVSIDGVTTAGASVLASRIVSSARELDLAVIADVDAQGNVTLANVKPGQYVLAVQAPNGGWAYQREESLDLRAGQTAEVAIDVRLARREVRVVDGSGKPLAFAPIEWITANGTNTAQGSTHEQGEIALRLPEGRVRFECEGRDLEPSEVEWSAGAAPLVLRATKRQ